MLIVGGWRLIAHPLFLDQFEKLGAAVARLRRKDPSGWHKSANAKLLAVLRQLVFETIPQDPGRPEYRQGGTLGDVGSHCLNLLEYITGDPVVQLSPPLICGHEEIDLMTEILRDVLTRAGEYV